MSLSLVLALIAGVLAGSIAALKLIAPKTATTKDDDVLRRLEALEAMLGKLLPGDEPANPAP